MTVYVTEYEHMGVDALGRIVPLGQEPATTTQKITAGSASSAFAATTNMVRLLSDADVHLVFAAESPSADTNDALYKANIEYWVSVQPGHALDTAAAV